MHHGWAAISTVQDKNLMVMGANRRHDKESHMNHGRSLTTTSAGRHQGRAMTARRPWAVRHAAHTVRITARSQEPGANLVLDMSLQRHWL